VRGSATLAIRRAFSTGAVHFISREQGSALSEETGGGFALMALSRLLLFLKALIHKDNFKIANSGKQTFCECPLGANFVFFPQHLSENGTRDL
jgi:hypothetical protein